jgi:hypothetical protein
LKKSQPWWEEFDAIYKRETEKVNAEIWNIKKPVIKNRTKILLYLALAALAFIAGFCYGFSNISS